MHITNEKQKISLFRVLCIRAKEHALAYKYNRYTPRYTAHPFKSVKERKKREQCRYDGYCRSSHVKSPLLHKEGDNEYKRKKRREMIQAKIKEERIERYKKKQRDQK